MLDITKAELIKYGEAQEVTVYDDFEDPGLKYVVPQPRFVRRSVGDATVPEFTLIEYTIEGGDRRGTCTFAVELTVPEDAWQAVKVRYPDSRFGQLQWVEAEAFLSFKVKEQQYDLLAMPSMAASNQASYVVDLDSADLVDFFKTSFGPGAPTLSQLKVRYDVTSLTKLRAVTATVEFKAERAFEYEKEVDVKKDMWGSVKSRKETIRQNLKASEAGTTKIDYNIPNPSDEFRQRVENWAFGTLESLVDQTVNEAAARLGPGNADQMSAKYVASFSRSYQENQVIEWLIAPGAFMVAREISSSWEQHYQKVDFRKLVATFTSLGDLVAAEIDRVSLDVTYHDVKGSFVFRSDGPASWKFEADGRKDEGGVFDPFFSYSYEVFYADGEHFRSEEISTSTTEVTLNLAELGLVEVRFSGANLDFEALNTVELAFAFQPPGDRPLVEETKLVVRKAPYAAFRSTYPVRVSDFSFTYGITYKFKDGTIYRVAPHTLSGASATRQVLLTDPLQDVQYSVGVNNVPKHPAISRLLLTATYDDEVNNLHEMVRRNFEMKDLEYDETVFSIRVVDNPNASYLRVNGRAIMTNGSVRTLNDIYLSGTETYLLLSSNTTVFCVKLDPFQVAWADGVTRVNVDMWTLAPAGGTAAGDRAVRPCLAEVLQRKTNVKALTFSPMSDGGLPTPPQFYCFDFNPITSPAYYFQIRYDHRDTGPGFVDDTTPSDKATIILPKDAAAKTPTVFAVELPREAGPMIRRVV